MDSAFPGLGTVINIVAIVVGALIGVTVGHRVAERTREVITDCLALVTLLMSAGMALAVNDASLIDAVGGSAPILIVLASLVIGSAIGSTIGIENTIARLGGRLQARFAATEEPAEPQSGPTGPAVGGDVAPEDLHVRASQRERFIEGFMTTSLLFCIGPVAVLGALQDGLGEGVDTLLLKSSLDGMAAIAFAASLGIGVAFSALPVGLVQGVLTLVGVAVGQVVPDYAVAALTATGGLLLVGISLRLLRIRDVRVGDMLPSLLLAPALAWAVAAFL